MANMGLQFGLETNSFEPDPTRRVFSKTCLRKFRWLLKIDGVSARGAQTLPPSQAARPNLAFTEFEVRHLHENYSYPAKPDWKPIQLTLFDVLKTNESDGRMHPVFEWLKQAYNPHQSSSTAVASASTVTWTPAADGFIRDADLEMYDGCGTLIESWVYENVWPQAIDFGTLDMANNEVVTCDLTLRYARAYIKN